MKHWVRFAAPCLALALLGCAMQSPSAPKAVAPQASSQPVTSQAADAPRFGTWGVDLTGLDRNVKPGDDFFHYVNGSWLAKATIPADRSSIGAFTELSILNEKRVNAIVADLNASADTKLSSEEHKVRDLYRSFLDTDRLEKLGLAPAQPDLNAIAAAKSHDDIARLMASVPLGTMSLFNAGIGIDDKASSNYALFLSQAGLGLPDRDYYRLDEKGIVTTRDAYHSFIGQMLALAGIADSAAKADRIYALEKAIADIHWPAEETRDATKIYNPMTVSELERFAPQFPWAAFLNEMGVGKPPQGERKVVVAEKSAFPELAALFAKTPVDVWRDYLTFHYLSAHAAYLPKRFDDLNFSFYDKVLYGRDQQLPRDTRAVRFLNTIIGECVGKLYVARYFPPEAKAKAKELVANLLEAYRQSIQSNDWMTDATRQKALEKIAHYTVKVGYPDKWRDYSNYKVDPTDLLGNAARGTEFEWHRELVRIDEPVDKDEWGLAPQTVNAYNNFNLNEVVFPAAILQPPFFDPNADDAVNYGGIGAIIGHEISHGFDDQGSKYNAQSMLEDWWTATDRRNFDARTQLLVDQYNSYALIAGLHVNGKLTLGENIADFAGATVSYDAYRLSLKGKPAPVLDGFTGEQRFFLGFGQIWRNKMRDEVLRAQMLSDPHSPSEFRVNGIVRNMPAWYQAFGITPPATLYLAPGSRISLW
jgi:putative endopeptidase